jgi:S1-C subfamily serine protease
VAPALIAEGSYTWPWLGVQGTSVNLALQEANDLESQNGAYIVDVSRDGPAEEAGLRGATDTRMVDGSQVAVGGDVIVAVDGNSVRDFADLLGEVAFRHPGETVELSVVREGRTLSVDVTLAPRPSAPGQ